MPDTLQETPVSEIIDYPVDKDGHIVTRRGGLSRMKPRLSAAPAGQPGSVDWTMVQMFGTREKSIQMIESLVSGQGEDADEKWVRFILLYREWELQWKRGELEEPPTLNQVAHSLNFPADQFISELQVGVQNLMRSLGRMKAAMVVPQVIENVNFRAQRPDADTKDIELHLRLSGVLDDKGGVSVNINNTNQNAVVLKRDKDRLRTPLLQFSDTVEAIDEEARNQHGHISAG